MRSSTPSSSLWRREAKLVRNKKTFSRASFYLNFLQSQTKVNLTTIASFFGLMEAQLKICIVMIPVIWCWRRGLHVFPDSEDLIINEERLEYSHENTLHVRIKGGDHPVLKSCVVEGTEYVATSILKTFHPFTFDSTAVLIVNAFLPCLSGVGARWVSIRFYHPPEKQREKKTSRNS